MKTDHDVRAWLTEEWAEECLLHVWRSDCGFRVWRMYWRFCHRRGVAPLAFRKWTAAVQAASGGTVGEIWQNEEGEARLLSASREEVRAALQPKTTNCRRKVSR